VCRTQVSDLLQNKVQVSDASFFLSGLINTFSVDLLNNAAYRSVQSLSIGLY
jgi:hypothetical protein